LAETLQKYPELGGLIEVWPRLPGDLRAAILRITAE
jgi:hypothetical protein